MESSGVFNTAELLVNQVSLNPNNPGIANSQRLQLLLNHYVESIERRADGRYTLEVTDAAAGQPRQFTAEIVVLAAGSIESPKILRRSPVFNALPAGSTGLVGKGLTDHPTTDSVHGIVTHIAGVSIPKDSHAKIIFYFQRPERRRRDHLSVQHRDERQPRILAFAGKRSEQSEHRHRRRP
jgi:L-2-hydroxyglutarate oxidase LhgO